MKWLCLAAGSLAGGFARYALGGWLQRLAGAGFPWGTLAVNLLGCLLIGIFARLPLGYDARVLLMTGFCGAFTTFSTLALEADGLSRAGAPGRAALYLAASLVLGLLLVRLGAGAAGLIRTPSATPLP